MANGMLQKLGAQFEKLLASTRKKLETSILDKALVGAGQGLSGVRYDDNIKQQLDNYQAKKVADMAAAMNLGLAGIVSAGTSEVETPVATSDEFPVGTKVAMNTDGTLRPAGPDDIVIGCIQRAPGPDGRVIVALNGDGLPVEMLTQKKTDVMKLKPWNADKSDPNPWVDNAYRKAQEEKFVKQILPTLGPDYAPVVRKTNKVAWTISDFLQNWKEGSGPTNAGELLTIISQKMTEQMSRPVPIDMISGTINMAQSNNISVKIVEPIPCTIQIREVIRGDGERLYDATLYTLRGIESVEARAAAIKRAQEMQEAAEVAVYATPTKGRYAPIERTAVDGKPATVSREPVSRELEVNERDITL